MKIILDSIFLLCLLAVSITDIRHRKIPNCYVVAITALSVVSLCIRRDTLGIGDMKSVLMGALCVSGFLLLTDLLVTGAFGGGDIKLAAAGGLYLGGYQALVSGILSLLFCACYIVGIRVFRKKSYSAKTELAFGPFLSLGMACSLFWGEHLIKWYMHSPFY